MKAKALIAFRSKFLNPCRKLLIIFKFKLRKPLFIRSLRIRPRHSKPRNKAPLKDRINNLLSFFRHPKEMNRLRELRSVSDASRRDRITLFPSPLTPAYVKATMASKREIATGYEDVEDACRSFENYLVEMIVEEGKVRDLMDVEELLHCWKNLRCPVFIDLVCRFYGELCKDLFSTDHNDNLSTPK